MNKQDLLIEIGCEEIPARFVEGAVEQLGEKLSEWLTSRRISFDAYQTYATPRRLAVLVSSVAERQEDINEEVKGPAARIAQTPDAGWSKAAEGFARKQGVSVEQLQLKEFKGETYVFAQVHHPGEKTVNELSRGLSEVFQGLHFPKTMRWGSNRTRFIRPVRWLVCLFGAETIPVQWAGIQAGNLTRGHRFLGTEIAISSPDQYVEQLREQYVIADIKERRDLVLSQLRQLEEKNNWQIPVDPALLKEVVHLVEYPTVLSGSFNEEFLSLPKAVLITTMKEHQRYFPVETKEGTLLPFFVTVRNGNDQELELVARGNEKVLRARLADARFFYEEDLKLSIETAVAKLDQIVYQEELGSMGDRVRRIQAIALKLGQQLQLNPQEMKLLERGARICKFDLSTQMVGEFPELEGWMGRDYARHAGEPDLVAEAVYQHHLPRSAGDELPQTTIGVLISLADKIDTIASSFGIGIQPTGSQDPYGLRRRAAGIVQILLQDKWSSVSLENLWQLALNQLEKAALLKVEKDEAERDLFRFFANRLKAVLQEENIRYDVIDAVLAAGINAPSFVLKKARVLMDQVDREMFKHEVEGFTRAANLAAKAGDVELYKPALIQPAERALVRALDEATSQLNTAQINEDPLGMYHAIARMVPQIHHFFDEVMVMVEDRQVRNNRLALLKEITRLVKQFAAFELIVFPS
ncbi:glycine--tRNA ligase subunit beta [Paenactinomyces guangxiensis]|uniref:Glycine--tRNA ligase beta subunit n=1 Tax=Paenactinomyces guangxiensis TaxID=1490290 RepID=A0A7W1WNH9_9BACL|nr:glycine--tRNA ligase subunit beta [Paenactinomyces guangxiensis]MBA4493165.1 glycine--tRNA ligase subunit beta [Paenactinomyces guangxiensis]MBH8589985.1 glycine--tRNA ligase subunit beta [Paenactinomyces guangxiensis]